MNFDYLNYPYPSQRMTMFGNKGMVATSQPLAAQAGLKILQSGGNAIDAAIVTAACLTVVEPTSNGIGGDAFALVWVNNKLHGLNASGPAPQKLTIEELKKRGYTEMPKLGMVPVTVPGAPAAWAELWEKFGRLPFEKLLEPAIQYAEEGYPVSPILGKYWEVAYNKYKEGLSDEEFEAWCRVFAPSGKAPKIGEVWRSEGHGDTLRKIATTKAKDFYAGELAEIMDKFFREKEGYLRKSDLENYRPEWVKPIKINYRGYDVWEIPPNGQGIITLMALNILKGFELSEKEEVETYHKQMEALKLAFVDGQHYITEKSKMKVKVEDLLSDGYGEERRKLIGNIAIDPTPGKPQSSGTVYLAAADDEGNMISFIQSNYMGFGSGIVVPGTGVALQNRGHDFSLDPNHANALEPGKKTYHTIIPGFLTKDDKPVGPFGVMGGFMQPQGHLQVLVNTVDFHLNPQAALDAPRWQWIGNKTIEVERGIPEHISRALARKGHDIKVALDSGGFGRGQIIWRDNETGVLIGGTEGRTDGTIALW
ncbi:MAG: gamma-glutamyltransferase [Clostridiaceae bacterium]|nr:gamma-glutamyltransferase [Clostridiaceae bacterium]